MCDDQLTKVEGKKKIKGRAVGGDIYKKVGRKSQDGGAGRELSREADHRSRGGRAENTVVFTFRSQYDLALEGRGFCPERMD